MKICMMCKKSKHFKEFHKDKNKMVKEKYEFVVKEKTDGKEI